MKHSDTLAVLGDSQATLSSSTTTFNHAGVKLAGFVFPKHEVNGQTRNDHVGFYRTDLFNRRKIESNRLRNLPPSMLSNRVTTMSSTKTTTTTTTRTKMSNPLSQLWRTITISWQIRWINFIWVTMTMVGHDTCTSPVLHLICRLDHPVESQSGHIERARQWNDRQGTSARFRSRGLHYD